MTAKKKLPQQNNNNENDDNVIVVDATKFVSVVASDAFHPSRLVTLLIDPEEITSTQLMGYGVLNDIETPIVRLIYKNGQAEDVFDVAHRWSK